MEAQVEQVQADLLLCKGWQRVQAVQREGVWMVEGSFTTDTEQQQQEQQQHVVVVVASSELLAPATLWRWHSAAAHPAALTVAVVDGDGAISYFAVGPCTKEPAATMPDAYN